MALTETSRHQLFQRLEESLGPEAAATLMEHLPPVGWSDVATRRDLDHLRTELELLFDARLERGFREQTRTLVLANLGYVTAFGSLILAAARL
jgi:hypothetical protein